MGQFCSQDLSNVDQGDGSNNNINSSNKEVNATLGNRKSNTTHRSIEYSAKGIEKDYHYVSNLNTIPYTTPGILKRLGPFKLDEKFNKHYTEAPMVRGPLKHRITGDTYQGEIIGDMLHGVGIYVGKDGTYIQGYFFKGFPDFKLIRVFPDCTAYHGEISDGKKNGNGIQILSDGDKITGQWLDDKMNGHILIEDAHDNKVFEGKMIRNRKEGFCYFRDRKNNTVYLGDYRDGLFYGFGKLESEEGLFEGVFHLGVKDGPGVFMKRDRTKITGIWKHNVLQKEPDST